MLHLCKRFLARRKAKDTLKLAKTTYSLYHDIFSVEKNASFMAHIDTLKAAHQAGDCDQIADAIEILQEEIEAYQPPCKWRFLSNNFDVLVSALSVALCFRAYYYQPFKIPTGSMQPTLYGIHTVDASSPTLLDKQPLRFCKWLITGETFEDVRIRRPGSFIRAQQSQSTPGYADVQIGAEVYLLPSDIAGRIAQDKDRIYRTGQRLWSGYVRSGDFLFVNRWLWNFRQPQRGEVVVFKTTGIPDLPPNIHYIKRLCGMPGDALSIQSPVLYNHGKPLTGTPMIDLISHQGSNPKASVPYAGFQPAPGGLSVPSQAPRTQRLLTPNDIVKLGPREFYAMGDNSDNSFDSRYWGVVKAEQLIGPPAFVHWPFTSPRWGRVR